MNKQQGLFQPSTLNSIGKLNQRPQLDGVIILASSTRLQG